jgi:hypothetical protein
MSEQKEEDNFTHGGSVTTVLLDAARQALGSSIELIFGPQRVRSIGEAKGDSSAYAMRRAAEAKAYEIVTIEAAKLEAESLRRDAAQTLTRARDRIISGEILKQDNIECVLAGAVNASQEEKPSGGPRSIDHDWMTRFIEGAGFISNQQLQEIWSRILFRQATTDSSGISIMTLDCLRLLDAELANIFLKVASLLSYFTILSDHNLIDLISKYPMAERTHLDRLEELGLLRYRDKESLFSMVGNAFCALDKRCFEVFGPPPRFFSLSIRGFELASALIKGYETEAGHPNIALEYLSSDQIRGEIVMLFMSSLGSDSELNVDISVDVRAKDHTRWYCKI